MIADKMNDFLITIDTFSRDEYDSVFKIEFEASSCFSSSNVLASSKY